MLTNTVPYQRMHFSKQRILQTPGFRDVITRERFKLISGFLHFSDNGSKSIYTGPSKLFKIFPTPSHLNTILHNMFLLEQNTATDASQTLCKGCLFLRQYLLLKSSKFKINTYELCESTSGYL
jgi:hypothetical protein